MSIDCQYYLVKIINIYKHHFILYNKLKAKFSNYEDLKIYFMEVVKMNRHQSLLVVLIALITLFSFSVTVVSLPHASMRKAKKSEVIYTRTVRKATQKVFHPHASCRKLKKANVKYTRAVRTEFQKSEKKICRKTKHLKNYLKDKWNI